MSAKSCFSTSRWVLGPRPAVQRIKEDLEKILCLMSESRLKGIRRREAWREKFASLPREQQHSLTRQHLALTAQAELHRGKLYAQAQALTGSVRPMMSTGSNDVHYLPIDPSWPLLAPHHHEQHRPGAVVRGDGWVDPAEERELVATLVSSFNAPAESLQRLHLSHRLDQSRTTDQPAEHSFHIASHHDDGASDTYISEDRPVPSAASPDLLIGLREGVGDAAFAVDPKSYVPPRLSLGEVILSGSSFPSDPSGGEGVGGSFLGDDADNGYGEVSDDDGKATMQKEVDIFKRIHAADKTWYLLQHGHWPDEEGLELDEGFGLSNSIFLPNELIDEGNFSQKCTDSNSNSSSGIADAVTGGPSASLSQCPDALLAHPDERRAACLLLSRVRALPRRRRKKIILGLSVLEDIRDGQIELYDAVAKSFGIHNMDLALSALKRWIEGSYNSISEEDLGALAGLDRAVRHFTRANLVRSYGARVTAAAMAARKAHIASGSPLSSAPRAIEVCHRLVGDIEVDVEATTVARRLEVATIEAMYSNALVADHLGRSDPTDVISKRVDQYSRHPPVVANQARREMEMELRNVSPITADNSYIPFSDAYDARSAAESSLRAVRHNGHRAASWKPRKLSKYELKRHRKPKEKVFGTALGRELGPLAHDSRHFPRSVAAAISRNSSW